MKKTQKIKKIKTSVSVKSNNVLVTLENGKNVRIPKIIKSDTEWKKILTPHQYNITRKKGTDKPRFGTLFDQNKLGLYLCTCCSLPLFSSDAKYESGSGWPSFYQPFSKNNVKIQKDYSNNMIRNEVLCKRCDSHLGHVFNDGPQPTGLRYCINYESIVFRPFL